MPRALPHLQILGLDRGLPDYKDGERGRQVAEGDEHKERREHRQERLDGLRLVLGQGEGVAADAQRGVRTIQMGCSRRRKGSRTRKHNGFIARVTSEQTRVGRCGKGLELQ
jgi:hypothetical protein